MLLNKKIKYEENKLIRYLSFLIGVVIVSISFNLFILPSNIVYGVSGIGVVLKNYLILIQPLLF